MKYLSFCKPEDGCNDIPNKLFFKLEICFNFNAKTLFKLCSK